MTDKTSSATFSERISPKKVDRFRSHISSKVTVDSLDRPQPNQRRSFTPTLVTASRLRAQITPLCVTSTKPARRHPDAGPRCARSDGAAAEVSDTSFSFCKAKLAEVGPTAVSYCNANRADEAVRGLHIELYLKSRRCARTDREAGDVDTDGDEELRSGSLDPLHGLHTVARTFSLRSRKRIRRLVGSLDLGATLYEFAKGDDPFRDRCLRSPP